MSLDKAIAHGKEHRKPYRGAKAIDGTCRNHGGCPWCEGNRKYKFRDKHPYDERGGDWTRRKRANSMFTADNRLQRMDADTILKEKAVAIMTAGESFGVLASQTGAQPFQT